MDTELQEMITKGIENPEEATITYTVLKGQLALKALGSRVIVLEDRFRTGNECKTCDGLGHLDEPCPQCEGDRIVLSGPDNVEMFCPTCRIDGRPCGYKLCPECKGKGALIIIPQSAERRPTSGIVMSKGEKVTKLKKGDHVLYTNYVGTAINFKQRTVIRILHEDDVMAIMYSVKEFNLGSATI